MTTLPIKPDPELPADPEDKDTRERRERIQWLHAKFKNDPGTLLKGLVAAYDGNGDNHDDGDGYDSMDSEDRDCCDRMNKTGAWSDSP